MSSIEHLKEEARRFEQDEQWEKALELYSEAIDQLADSHQPDIALFNRSGDLATKIGSAAQAVSFYERAVDYYMDAGLPNNAIAICKKVMRNLPDRHSIHLKMGQIHARQGLVSEARTSFVTYAERVQAGGDLEEALRALVEFVNLAPDDYEIAMMLASQLEQHDRTQEALIQYIGAYRSVRRQGLSDLVTQLEGQIKRLDPQLNLEKAASDEHFVQPTGVASKGEADEEGDGSKKSSEVEIIGPVDLPLMSFDDDDDEDDAAADAGEEAAAKAAQEAAAKAAQEAAAAEAAEGAAAAAQAAADEARAKAEQDATAKAAQEAAAGAAEEAAAAGAAEEAAGQAAAAEAAAAQAAAAEKAAAEKAATQAAAAEAAAAEAARDAAVTPPEEAPSVPSGDPASETEASSDGQYVDLGAVLLGEEVHTGEKSTRFVVPYEEPTGDDQADFEKMLAQFREKVSENIEPDDAIAHYDLGTAYMEMGLLDEAISEFQMVLRGTSDHLPTYEMLGKTFLQKQEPEAALRSLTRGLDAPCEIEEDRVGIYYYIGLSHETLEDKDTAMEYYDRVFAIDINFADVTERLKALRS